MNDEIRVCMLLHGWDEADITQIIQHESRVKTFMESWPATPRSDDWGEHDVYTMWDWHQAVASGETRLAYWDWALSRYEEERADDARRDAKEETS